MYRNYTKRLLKGNNKSSSNECSHVPIARRFRSLSVCREPRLAADFDATLVPWVIFSFNQDFFPWKCLMHMSVCQNYGRKFCYLFAFFECALTVILFISVLLLSNISFTFNSLEMPPFYLGFQLFSLLSGGFAVVYGFVNNLFGVLRSIAYLFLLGKGCCGCWRI